MTGEIQVFESSLEDCDPFKFIYVPSPDTAHRIPLINMSLVVPDSLLEKLRPWCYLEDRLSVAEGQFYDFSKDVGSAKILYKCANSTSIDSQDHRILLASRYYRLDSNDTEYSGFMCEPTYTLTRRTVTNSTRYAGYEDRLEIDEAIAQTLEIGVQPLDMTVKILKTAIDGWRMNSPSKMWFNMLNFSHLQNDQELGFRNTNLFIEASQRTWKGLAAYVVKQEYTIPSEEIINGTSVSIQGRLCVQLLSLRLIEAQITLLIALIVGLCFFRAGLFHRNPTSLGAHAMILARSPGLVGHLQGYGVKSKQVLRESLSGYTASFPPQVLPESPAISLHYSRRGSGEITEKPTRNNNNADDWWSPMSVRWWFRTSLMTAILAVVIALEVLLHVSNRGNGLRDVNLEGYLKYTWSFLPTLVLVLLGLLFSMVDSTARISHPFQLLRNGRASMNDLLHDPTRQVSLMAVLHAGWKGQFVLLWVTLPGLLSPVLTIISSGLYTVAPVPWTYDAELELKDWFLPEDRSVNDIDSLADSDSAETSDIFTLTQLSNMPYPQWTQWEYALASFGADNLHSHDGNDTSLYITARIPAARQPQL